MVYMCRREKSGLPWVCFLMSDEILATASRRASKTTMAPTLASRANVAMVSFSAGVAAGFPNKADSTFLMKVKSNSGRYRHG